MNIGLIAFTSCRFGFRSTETIAAGAWWGHVVSAVGASSQIFDANDGWMHEPRSRHAVHLNCRCRVGIPIRLCHDRVRVKVCEFLNRIGLGTITVTSTTCVKDPWRASFTL